MPALPAPEPLAARPLLVALALLAATLLAYAPALRAGYVWDDDSYLTENAVLTEPGGLARVWLEPRATPQYYPLVFTTFWLERRLWGLAPLGYHLVNVLLHATSALLLWRLLARLRVPGALLAGFLFALHPVHVESVAWVTERKNTLSLALALGAATAWLRAFPPERGAGGPAGGARRRYALCLLLFAAALLSKSVTGVLPFALAAIVWWKRGRIGWAELAALAPLVLLAVPAGLHTAHIERVRVGAQGIEFELTPPERLLLAGRAFWFYAGKVGWPHPLIFFYPRVPPDAGAPSAWLAPAGVVLLFATLFLARARIGRGPLAACVLFGLGIGPASGFFDVFPMRYSFVADHFQYQAAYALLVLAAAGLTRLGERLAPRARAARAGLAAALLCAPLGALTWSRAHAFADGETLWRDTLAQNETCWIAWSHLAAIAFDAGRIEEGREAQLRAARHCDFPSEAWADAAGVHVARGEMDRALELYGPVLEAHPVGVEKLVAIARGLQGDGRGEDARRLLALCVERVPGDASARVGLGDALALAARPDEARRQYEAALALDAAGPWAAEACFGLGASHARAGDFAAAVPFFERALALRPGSDRAQRALQEARRRAGGG